LQFVLFRRRPGGKPGEKTGDKAFPTRVPALTGAPPEGFTIGKGTIAYNSSVDGSIYRVDLRSGEGETIVQAEPDFDIESQCFKLGLRVDPRSNYLFVAGCVTGEAYVYDADTGEAIETYPLAAFGNVINDVVITREAVFFTDFTAPFLYRLPLSRNGRLPPGAAALPIPLAGNTESDDLASPATANGIVASPNGDTLIIGDSSTAQIYRVDPLTGHSDRIMVDKPLTGFIDGIVLRQNTLYILSPANPGDPDDIDRIQIVTLDKDWLTGIRLDDMTDPENLDGVASGAMFGNTLYVNNARYTTLPGPDAEYWITRLNIDKGAK
jgi:hypothetical protein